MKTYVLTVSRTFPKTHKRAGEQTFFPEMILTALMGYKKGHGLIEKIHTIRANYELWEKRAKEINDGKAILSIRYWSEKPYRSKQVEICQLTKIGVQKCNILLTVALIDSTKTVTLENISKNDGLSFDDFVEWFKNYDLLEPMAIIQFTDFRY